MGRVEQEIKGFALKKTGILAVGISSEEDINRYAPFGYRPNDQLPGASSLPVSMQGKWDIPPLGWEIWWWAVWLENIEGFVKSRSAARLAYEVFYCAVPNDDLLRGHQFCSSGNAPCSG